MSKIKTVSDYEVTSWNGTDAMLAAEEIAYTPKKEEVSV